MFELEISGSLCKFSDKMLDALHFCHVCKSVCFCLNQKLVVSLVPRVLTPVTHVTPPLDRPTSGYKFSSVGNYIQSSKVSLHVRLKDGHYPDEMPASQMPDALMKGHHTMGRMPGGPTAAMPPWRTRCLRGPWRGSCQSIQMSP